VGCRQADGQIRRRTWPLVVLVALVTMLGAPVSAGPPALPSSFWGTVEHADGHTVQAGTVVQALVDGRVCGEGRVQPYEGLMVYGLHVLADDTETTEKDGGREGDAVTIEICDTPLDVEATWHGGANVRVDLVIPAGVLCPEPPPTYTPRPTLARPTQTVPPTLTPTPSPTPPEPTAGPPASAHTPLEPVPTVAPTPHTEAVSHQGAALPAVLVTGAVVLAGAGVWLAARRR